MLLQTKAPVEETRKKIWLVDSKVHGAPGPDFLLVKEYLLMHNILYIAAIKCYDIRLQGLIVRSRLESLQHFKKPWAHEHEPVKTLLEAVKVCNFRKLFQCTNWTMTNAISSSCILNFVTSAGDQANSVDRIIRHGQNLHQGSARRHGFIE